MSILIQIIFKEKTSLGLLDSNVICPPLWVNYSIIMKVIQTPVCSSPGRFQSLIIYYSRSPGRFQSLIIYYSQLDWLSLLLDILSWQMVQ